MDPRIDIHRRDPASFSNSDTMVGEKMDLKVIRLRLVVRLGFVQTLNESCAEWTNRGYGDKGFLW